MKHIRTLAMFGTMAALEGFTPLGINSCYWQPDARAPIDSAYDAPQLVILCSWMGAQPKHIAKYTSAYQKLLPHARIIVIQSHILDMVFRSSQAQQNQLKPATEIVLDLVRSSEAGARLPIVLHIFSHGGSNSSIQLLKAVAAARPGLGPIQFKGFILDSTPGSSDYWRSYAAIATIVPKAGVMRWIGILFVHLTLWVSYTLALLGLTAGIKELRQRLLDPDMYSKATKRTYIYSKADKMVDWKLVKRHAEEAEALGYQVEQMCFEKSSHCGHAMLDANGYWGAAQKTWQ